MAIKIIHACLNSLSPINVLPPAIDGILSLLQLSEWRDDKSVATEISLSASPLTNMTHPIKYGKRRTPEPKLFKWILTAVYEEKKFPQSLDNGHFHYCCAIFTNNNFQTLHMKLCMRLSRFFHLFHSISACSFHSSGRCSVAFISLLSWTFHTRFWS